MVGDDAGVAIVRQELAKLPSVSRTWFEWTFEDGGWLRTLLVEVRFDTDPNSPGFNAMALDDIEAAVRDTLTTKTTMTISHLRVVPKTGAAS